MPMHRHALADYRRAELRRAPHRLAAAATLAGLLMIAGSQIIFTRMPAQVIAFLRLGFNLDDLGAVVLFNDYAAVYFCALFVGIFGLLRVVVGPREEHQLEILLSKPVPAGEFLAARTWPVLLITALVGLALSLACALATLPYPGSSVSLVGALGAGLALTAVVLLQLTALGLAFVRLADSTDAVLLALLFALLPMLPSAVFLYRPDLFVDSPRLTHLTVVASLVWHDDLLVWLGPTLLLLALLCALAGVRLGGARLSSRST